MPEGINWRARGAALAIIAGIAVLGVWTFTHLKVSNEITHFLPSSEDRELAQIAREVSASDLNRSIILLVSGGGEEETIAAARALAGRLEQRPEVAWVRTGPGEEDMGEAFHSLYFERRLGFFTDRPERPITDEALSAHARELRQRITSAAGPFVRRIAPDDPLLIFVRHLEALQEAQQGGLEITDGQLMTGDGRAVIFLASVRSPFHSEPSRRLLDGIDEDLRAVRAERGSPISIEMSAVHRFAVQSEAEIRADITRISVVSSLGVVLLFLVLFRSLRYLVLAAIPLGAGFVMGLAVTQVVFGQIHGLSLAFGATLIGVAIDYVVHALNHHTLAPSPLGPEASFRRIWPGLALGATTTIAGLAGLTWTSFPGIRELALLTSVGVLTALLCTRWLLPPFLPRTPTPTRLHRRVSDRLGEWMKRLGASRRALLVLPLLSLVACALGLAKLEWVDDVRVLNTFDADLMAEDETVRAAVSRMDSGRFVIAWGEDDESALERNDEVFARLTEAREAGELSRFRSIHSLLWSRDLQRRSFEALHSSPGLFDRLVHALEAEGFVTGSFSPFRDVIEGDPPEPLTYQELAESPLGSLVSSFRVELEGGRVAYLTLTRGADVDAIERRLEGLDGVRLFDQSRFLQAAYGAFRQQTLEMIGVGLVLVFLLVLARYRRLGPSLAAFLPAVLAAATSLSLLVLAGYEANLMHLVALLLVLSMGVDYGVFMVESRRYEEGPAPTVMSLVVACVSTVLSFGLLAMSANPALRALGLVTGIGVLLSLLLAPTAWLLLGPPPEDAK